MKIITKIYGLQGAILIHNKVAELAKNNCLKITKKLNQSDIFVITYANSIQTAKPNLANVPNFLDYYYPFINNIHFLPFFSWTSDDGFAISDYYQIDSRYGKWSDLTKINPRYQLMFDLVINHTSSEHHWFKKFLVKEQPYDQFYLTKESDFDYSKIIRPRTSPLFHNFSNQKVWTTFSEDQVDLNFRSPHLFVKILEILDFYMQNGMQTIRLDAVGFLWKASGHSGMHHQYTHDLIKAWKGILQQIYGNITIIAEVNVPHEENMTYLGHNGDEADLVYNFALPPLMAYTLLSEDATKFKKWFTFFDKLSGKETMFNFLASHDGIGIRPVEKILSQKEIALLLIQAKKTKSKISYKTLANKQQAIYEINTTFTDLVFKNNGEQDDLKRYLLAHKIILFLKGVPAFYFNSLFMIRNWQEGYQKTQVKRTLNRRLFTTSEITNIASQEKVQNLTKELNTFMQKRAKNADFDPYTSQKVITNLPKEIIGFSRNQKSHILANVSNRAILVKFQNQSLIVPPLELIIL